MRLKLLAATVLAAGMAFPANAADIYAKAPPTKAPPAATERPKWNGFYVGGHGGWAEGTFTPVSTDAFTIPDAFSKFTTNGFVYGGHAGANWQYGHVILGIETRFTWYDHKDSVAFGGDNSVNVRLRYIADALVRGGVTVGDNFMVFAAGGASWANAEGTLVLGGDTAAIAKANHFGYAVGGGAEWMAFGNRHVIVSLLYLYRDLGEQNYTPSAPFGSFSIPVGLKTHEITGGLKFKF